jgi:hypothetical protein
MNYFDHQFLRKEDFQTAQSYHVNRLRQHDRLLHQPGVIDGLVITVTGARIFTISTGHALDMKHREVVLRQTTGNEALPLVRVQDSTSSTGYFESEIPVSGTILTIDLMNRLPAGNQPVNITIQQGVKEVLPTLDPGVRGSKTRLEEQAIIAVSTAAASGAQLHLATLNRNGGNINIAGNPDLSQRKNAGAVLGDGSVTTDKLRDRAVTTPKLDDGAVTAIKLQSDANNDNNRAVTKDHLRKDAVTTEKIVDGAVTAAKLQSDASNNGNRAVTTNHLQTNAVTADKLLSDGSDNNKRAVTTNHLQDNAVTNPKIAKDAVITDKIANGAVTDDKIAGLSLFKVRGQSVDFTLPVLAGKETIFPLGQPDLLRLISVDALSTTADIDWRFKVKIIVVLGTPRRMAVVAVVNNAATDVDVQLRAYVFA